MVSVKQSIERRVTIGAKIEDYIKEGYTKGSWAHIQQSDKVLLKAWKPIKRKDAK